MILDDVVFVFEADMEFAWVDGEGARHSFPSRAMCVMPDEYVTAAMVELTAQAVSFAADQLCEEVDLSRVPEFTVTVRGLRLWGST